MQAQTLAWEDPLEKERATHSRILAWEIPRTEEPGGAGVAGYSPQGLQRVRRDPATIPTTASSWNARSRKTFCLAFQHQDARELSWQGKYPAGAAGETERDKWRTVSSWVGWKIKAEHGTDAGEVEDLGGKTWQAVLKFYFFFLAVSCCTWDLNSPTRDQTKHPPATEAQSLNYWTTREIL